MQEPWSATSIGWDTTDLTLDVVVDGDTFKDEDELDWAQLEGVFTAGEAARIREIGRRAHEHVEERAWPLDADWHRWIPVLRDLPELPESWSE